MEKVAQAGISDLDKISWTGREILLEGRNTIHPGRGMAAGRCCQLSDERAWVQVIWRTAWLETAVGVPPPAAAAAAAACPGASLTSPPSHRQQTLWVRAEDGTDGTTLGRCARDARFRL